MTESRKLIAAVAALTIAVAASDAHAVRFATKPLLWHRTAVSGYAGASYPVGVFASDDLPGDGNHAANWPLDWAVEVEHFAGRTWSLGFSAAYATFDDNDDPELNTNLDTYSGFVRIVVPSGTSVRPYFRAGMGGVQVEFEKKGEFRVDSEYEFSFQAGAGLLWLPARWLGLNAQVLYNYGDTENAFISEADAVVGFDVTYWTFTGGVSVFFP